MGQNTKKKREKKLLEVIVCDVYRWVCPKCHDDNDLVFYDTGDISECLCGQRVRLI